MSKYPLTIDKSLLSLETDITHCHADIFEAALHLSIQNIMRSVSELSKQCGMDTLQLTTVHNVEANPETFDNGRSSQHYYSHKVESSSFCAERVQVKSLVEWQSSKSNSKEEM